jgi:short-subunit dehydrogenase
MKLSDKYRAAEGDSALITGAAGGIGFAIADALGSLGYGLVLADIDGEGLQRGGADLRARHGVEIRTVRIDLSQPDTARRLYDFCAVEGILPVIVVNNAGVFSYNDIVATDPARIELFAGLHVVTPSLICRLFGEAMAARGGQGEGSGDADKGGCPGYILNMSSYSTWMPWPGIAMYSATKAYVRNFSLALAAEMRDRGVRVTTVMPAGVTTGLYGLSPRLQTLGRRLGLLMPPERLAGSALRAMFRGRRQLVPGVFMRLVLPLVQGLPAGIVRLIRRKTLKYQK